MKTGSRKRPHLRVVPCPDCDGTGKVRDRETPSLLAMILGWPLAECGSCLGSGKTRRKYGIEEA